MIVVTLEKKIILSFFTFWIILFSFLTSFLLRLFSSLLYLLHLLLLLLLVLFGVLFLVLLPNPLPLLLLLLVHYLNHCHCHLFKMHSLCLSSLFCPYAPPSIQYSSKNFILFWICVYNMAMKNIFIVHMVHMFHEYFLKIFKFFCCKLLPTIL